MDYKYIIVEKDGNIALLTLNRPEDYNRLNPKMFAEISDALQKLAEDNEVRALIMRAAGRNFCVGMTSEEFETGGTAVDACVISTDKQSKAKSLLELIEMDKAYDNMLKAIADFPREQSQLSMVGVWRQGQHSPLGAT